MRSVSTIYEHHPALGVRSAQSTSSPCLPNPKMGEGSDDAFSQEERPQLGLIQFEGFEIKKAPRSEVPDRIIFGQTGHDMFIWDSGTVSS